MTITVNGHATAHDDRAQRVLPAIMHAQTLVSDELVKRAEALADKHKLGEGSEGERSPLKNLQAVAGSPGSGLRVLQNFIRYQAGRKDSGSRFWSRAGFAQDLVEELDRLGTLRDQMAKGVAEGGIQLTEDEKADIHMRLARLYLGYLARYQVYLKTLQQRGGR